MTDTFLVTHAPSNPTLEYADSIVVPSGTREIISEGGGSTIDVGKWLSRKYGIKHTAIPTTAGTGSEVTKYCVLTTNGKKHTYTDVAFIPDAYVLDPRKVVSLPPLHTLSSGLDTICQAVESLWSVQATPESRFYSQMAYDLAVQALPQSLKDPWDENLRMNMMLAANFSGRAINLAPTNICHAISYPLTDWYGIPHGIACAVSLNYFVKKILKLDLTDFLKSLDIPKYDILNKSKVVKEVLKNEKVKQCQVEITSQDILKSISQ